MKKILVINIEIKARELNSRIMIGYEALKRGYEVVIGAQSEMYEFLKYVPKAIFLDKSISRNKLNKLKKIKRLGHKIINLDEEGIASQNNKHFYLKQRMSTETLDLTDYFFTWGDDENNLIESQFYEYKSKIKTTGNPRIELWKPEYKELYKDEVIQISNQYKDFIFITSNFALVQHARGEDFLKSQESAFSQVETQKDEEILNSQKKYFTLMHTAFLKMINVLAKSFPNRTIVIRPHPSDNIQIWKENTKEYQNVFIEYKYSATPWIIASSCMIHSSCATGIEGFLMNKPVFSFLPYKDNKFIEYIFSLNENYFMKNGLSKFMLRNFMKNKLPESYFRKKKIGRPGNAKILIFKHYFEKFCDYLDTNKYHCTYFDSKLILKNITMEKKANRFRRDNRFYFRVLNYLIWKKNIQKNYLF